MACLHQTSLHSNLEPHFFVFESWFDSYLRSVNMLEHCWARMIVSPCQIVFALAGSPCCWFLTIPNHITPLQPSFFPLQWLQLWLPDQLGEHSCKGCSRLQGGKCNELNCHVVQTGYGLQQDPNGKRLYELYGLLLSWPTSTIVHQVIILSKLSLNQPD